MRLARPWQRWTAVAAGLAVVVGGSLLGVARSPLFHLDEIRVAGASRLSDREVVRLSGLAGGENVLLLRGSEVEARLEANPWVADATVVRSLPSAVVLRIAERHPIAAVQVGRRFLLMAEDGTPLEWLGEDPGLPLLVAPTEMASRVAAPGGVQGPLTVLGAMTPALRSRVAEVVVGSDGGMELRLESGTRVRLGSASRVSEKVQALVALLRWAREEGVMLEAADVRAPGAPVAQPA